MDMFIKPAWCIEVIIPLSILFDSHKKTVHYGSHKCIINSCKHTINAVVQEISRTYAASLTCSSTMGLYSHIFNVISRPKRHVQLKELPHELEH